MKLNLETKNKEQEVIKEYLENNVSEILANKINNGVEIKKEEKILINKKDLDGFIKYATEEARKQAEKGATSACIRDEVVFGWAIHYFEEDSIEGKLYNQDGTEYVVNPKFKPKEYYPTSTPQPKIEKPKQQSLFDFLTSEKPKQDNNEFSYKAQCSTFSQPDLLENDEENENDFDAYEQDEELFGEEKYEKIQKNEEKNEKNSNFLQKNQEINYETGEIIIKKENTNTFDKDILESISVLLNGNIIAK